MATLKLLLLITTLWLPLNSLASSPSSYWIPSNQIRDISCRASGNFRLSTSEISRLHKAELASKSDRHLIIHPQPLEFPSPNKSWSDIYSQNFSEIKNTLGNLTGNFKVATAMTLYALETQQPCELENQLQVAFEQAEKHDIPLLIHIDFEWMINWRPDIWNWYDSGQPGYQASNRDKVEWSDWGQPIRKFGIFWDHAGFERKARICYANPDIHREVIQKGRFIAAIINKWRLQLADKGRSHLFAGVDPGWETGIQDYRGVNAAKKMGVDYNLGFCALSHEGYSANKLPANANQVLTEVVRKYVELESRIFFEAGIPRDKIYTHIVGTDGDSNTPPHPGRLFYQRSPLEVAFNPYSTPGFSLYPGAYDPNLIKKHVQGKEWAITETAFTAISHLYTFAGDPKLRNINIYSWDMIKGNPSTMADIRTLMRYPLNSTNPPLTPPPIQSDVIGAVEILDGDTLKGWACQPGNTGKAIIEIHAGQFGGAMKLVATLASGSEARPDLNAACQGQTHVGWNYKFTSADVSTFQGQGIHVKAKQAGKEAWLYKAGPYVVPSQSSKPQPLPQPPVLNPAPAPTPPPAPPTAPPPTEVILHGSVENLQGDTLTGWACVAGAKLNSPATVEIFTGDFFNNPKLFKTIQTQVSRSDKVHVCGSNLLVGWSYTFTSADKKSRGGQDLHIKTRFQKTDLWLYKPGPYKVP